MDPAWDVSPKHLPQYTQPRKFGSQDMICLPVSQVRAMCPQLAPKLTPRPLPGCVPNFAPIKYLGHTS